jgi:alkanesulfonate monooxygenase SsuD/methylene tetrahydromethanopterin reductase-like flavin-dependent oxidoreductase (luciferase family)
MPAWPEVLAFAEHAEALGLDSVWVCDHFLSGPPAQPVGCVNPVMLLVGTRGLVRRAGRVGGPWTRRKSDR